MSLSVASQWKSLTNCCKNYTVSTEGGLVRVRRVELHAICIKTEFIDDLSYPHYRLLPKRK